MIKFKSLSLDDKTLFNEYLKSYNYSTCEYSFATLYLWRKPLDIKFTLIDDTLIIMKKSFAGYRHFMQPIGFTSSNIQYILDILINFRISGEVDILFADVEESFLNNLTGIYKDSFLIKEDRNNFDYIYETKNLIELSGKNYYNKKNHYKKFVKNYLYKIRDLNEPEIIHDSMDVMNKWYENSLSVDKLLNYEMLGILDLLNNYKHLNIDGMAVYIGSSQVGFTLGERINNDMAIIHVEKGDKKVQGIYSFINREFLSRYYSSTKYVNREQDLGIKGLRDAKISYFPYKLEKKYIVDIK